MTTTRTAILARLIAMGMVVVLGPLRTEAADDPGHAHVAGALRKAIGFFRENCSKHGGYVWRYSLDLRLSEGEAETGPHTIWVQPPGTPSVGMALLDAYETTDEPYYLQAAVDAAHALVRGQLQSGGWNYRVEFDPAERRRWGYRDNPSRRPHRGKRNRTNITTLDDDTTPAAVRFLARVDQTLGFRDEAIHESVEFALEALLKAQYPNGGWYQNWDRYPQEKGQEEFPIVRASYPNTWSRKWGNDWPGRYFTNDNVAGRMISTMLAVWEIYQDDRHLASARRTGQFLILAQMPDPQPAWAQQYDVQMHPCWDRKFEPPAISSWESQDMMEALMLLYRKTADATFLEPIPRALAYLRRSQLGDGRLARFYELETNRPLYFTRDYKLTYRADDVPTHYGFIMESRLEQLQGQYDALRQQGPVAPSRPVESPGLAGQVSQIIAAMDGRGAWVDRRGMKGYQKASPNGVIQSETFIRNTRVLCQYLRSVPRQ